MSHVQRTISDMKNKEKQYTVEIKQFSDDLENVRGQLEIAQVRRPLFGTAIEAFVYGLTCSAKKPNCRRKSRPFLKLLQLPRLARRPMPMIG